jgi:3-hydroxy-D-aspartate aldolase
MINYDDLKCGVLTRDDLPTPALMLDMDAFESNVAKMVAHAREHNRALRPHGKTHKCPEVAKALIRAGAVGACTAKISEAEAFAQNGVTGILVTTAVVGKHKIERAVRLTSAHPDMIFAADDAQNVRDLNDAAGAGKVGLNLAVDLWVGRRTGIKPGAAALELAQLIDSLPHVSLAGLQAYAGHASHVIGFQERKKASREAMGPAVETRCLIEAHGIHVPLLTGSSTGTYNIDSEIDGVTELQPGSFMFMDVDYRRIGGQDGPVYRDFHTALSVITTVVSKPADAIAVVDGGFKAFSTDKPFAPEACSLPGLTFSWAGDEHGIIRMDGASLPVKVGDRIEFIIPHCDPSVNLYDRIYCLRGENVEDVWNIAARGMSQ